jgi:glycerol-3-phosphate acyltransferase PlsY
MDIQLVGRFALVVLEAFLLGSIPTSYLIGKSFYGIDPRQHGSGATGATNTARSMGAKAGIATMFIDIFKGWASLALVKGVLMPSALFSDSAMYWACAIAMVAVVAGHSFSPWLQFKGGKGVAVAGGAAFALWPPLCLIELALVIIIVLIFRYVSLGSITAAILLPILIAGFPATRHMELVVGGALAGLFVVWLHRENIARLFKGTENKLSLGKVEKREDKA